MNDSIFLYGTIDHIQIETDSRSFWIRIKAAYGNWVFSFLSRDIHMGICIEKKHRSYIKNTNGLNADLSFFFSILHHFELNRPLFLHASLVWQLIYQTNGKFSQLAHTIPFLLYCFKWILNIIHTFESFLSRCLSPSNALNRYGIAELDVNRLWRTVTDWMNIYWCLLMYRRGDKGPLITPSSFFWVPLCAYLMMVSKMQMWTNSSFLFQTHIHTLSDRDYVFAQRTE